MSAMQKSTDVHQAFRQVVLNRLRQYQSGGLEAVPEYHDRETPVRPAAVFSEILRQTPYLSAHVPRVQAYLQQFPSGETRDGDSSMLWSKMKMNSKAVVMVTHLTVFQPDPTPLVPAVMLAGKQVYASRYMNGDLTLTMVFAGGAGTSSYLVHVNRVAPRRAQRQLQRGSSAPHSKAPSRPKPPRRSRSCATGWNVMLLRLAARPSSYRPTVRR